MLLQTSDSYFPLVSLMLARVLDPGVAANDEVLVHRICGDSICFASVSACYWGNGLEMLLRKGVQDVRLWLHAF
jgi:hypothetical protein